MTDGRTRNWNVIVYPESAPDNWRERIDELHIKWVCSPLHDKDVTAVGEPKKAHYHVLLMYDSVKSYKQVLGLTESLQAPIPQRCASVEGSIKYMLHLENPDKYQYSREGIEVHGDIDINKYLSTASSRCELMDEIVSFVIENGVVEFMDLMAYALHERSDWVMVLHGSCYGIVQLIRSQRHACRRPLNPVTGESY